MIYDINIVTRFDNKLSDIELDQLKEDIISAVDNYTGYASRSFIVEEKEDNRYEFDIEVTTDKILRSDELYNDNMFMCTVVEKRFNPKHSSNVGIFWTNEGMTTYHDGGTYISPNYDLYVNGNNYYTIQYVPVAIKNMYDRDKQRYNGVTYMWRCTGSWDNFMQAKTIDEAIEEFEKYYQKQLWRAVEGCRKHLEEATDNFAQFEDYRWRKK